MIKTFTFLLVLVASLQLSAAENPDDHTKHHKHQQREYKNIVSFLYGTSIIPGGNPHIDGVLLVPTIGLEYERWFSRKLGAGVFTDLAMSPYVIEADFNDDMVHIDREYVMVMTVALLYEPFHNFMIFAGPGVEFERNQNLFVQKMGVTYSFPIQNNWVIKAGASYENIELYDAFGVGVSFGKAF